MDVQAILAEMGGVSPLARDLGIGEAEAERGASALLPALLGGFKKQTQAQPTGVAGLAALLGQLGGGGLLDEVLAPRPTNVAPGNAVLEQIFGSKDVSRTVAASAASSTGLDSSTLRRMLPMLAMLVAGYMAKQRSAPESGGPSAGEPRAGKGSGGGGLGGLIGGILASRASSGGGADPLARLLDLNRDGNPLDEILRMAGKRGP